MRVKHFLRQQRGLGLVELMVGITVGLIVAAGASLVAVNQINEHRRLMLETQVQQDLRTAADLLQQEMRRAGFRGKADLGVWAPAKGVGSLNEQGASTSTANAYSSFAVTMDATGTEVHYLYARLDPVTVQYNATGTPSGNEQSGFRWDKTAQVLYMQLGVGPGGQPNWQPITDPDILSITDFRVSVSSATSSPPIDLGAFCDQPCGLAGTPSCPTLAVREVSFVIVGKAKHDDNVVRTLTGSERIRADAITGACP